MEWQRGGGQYSLALRFEARSDICCWLAVPTAAHAAAHG